MLGIKEIGMFLDDFFRVNAEFELPAKKGKVPEKIIVRTLSDSEIQERSDYALSEQANVGNLLRDTESDLYKVKIRPLMDANAEALIDTMAEIRRVDATREAQELFPLDFFPFPDDATDQEKIDTLKRQKEHEETVYANRAKYVVNDEAAYRKRWADLPMDALLANAKIAASRLYMLKAHIEAEIYYTLSRSCETLDGNPRWKIEQVKSLPGRITDRLMAKYHEADSVDPWELTKSESEGDSGGVVAGDTNGERHDGGEAS